jgi:outer membrane protein assembly factor BamB
MMLHFKTSRRNSVATTTRVATVVFMVGLYVLNTDCVYASDWDRFRGPNGTGISPDADPLPTTFSDTENLQWKVALPGAGVSCPIVVGERIFVTCYAGYGLDRQSPGRMEDLTRHLLCLNRTDGKVLWTKTVNSVSPEDPFSGMGVPEHGYASHTPTSDGKNVYVFFGKSGVLAYDMEGNKLWETSVGTESDDRGWGSSSSPIVAAGPESRAIVGLDKASGKELWRADSDGLGNVWGTPALAKLDDERTDIVIGAPDEIWGINPATGKLKWYCEAMATDQFNSSVAISDNVIYAVEGRGGGSIAIRAGGKGDITKTNVVWTGRDSSRFSTPLIYESRMYLISGGVARCIDTVDDKQIFEARLPSVAVTPTNDSPSDEGGSGSGRAGGGRGRFGGGRGGDYSSPVLGDGKIYYVTRSGSVHVIKPGGTFETLATNRLTADAEDFSATPAISDGQIFIRSDKHLYCISAKKNTQDVP